MSVHHGFREFLILLLACVAATMIGAVSAHALIDFEDALGADGDDFVTANGAIYQGLDWENPVQADPNDTNSWEIDADNDPFASAGGGTVWLQGFAQGDQNRIRIRYDGVHPFAFESIELRTRHVSDGGTPPDTNLDGVDDRWLPTVVLRFRDIDNNESLHVVNLSAVADWILVHVDDVGGAADMTRLKAIFLEGDSGTTVPGVTNDRVAIDNLVLLPCANGLDDDGDGLTDWGDDIGCFQPDSESESPGCQDGVDNDLDGLIDFDGGASAGVPLVFQTAPDLNCQGLPFRNSEKFSGSTT